MICMTYKISVLLKITKILKMLFKEYKRLLFFKKSNYFFLQHIMIENPRPEKENKISDAITFLD